MGMKDAMGMQDVMGVEQASRPRGILLAELIDRAKHDRTFRRHLHTRPEQAVARMGLSLLDAEWAGLAALLYPEAVDVTRR
jgi:hypothetical protein